MGGVSCSKVLLAKAVSNRWATLQKRGEYEQYTRRVVRQDKRGEGDG